MGEVIRVFLRIVIALFAVIVVLVAYRVANSPFEVVVVSGLAIIFANVNLMHRSLLIDGDEREDREVQRFLRTLHTLHDPKAGDLSMKSLKVQQLHSDTFFALLPYTVADIAILLIALVKLLFSTFS